MTDTTQKQLGKTLWSIADQQRGAMDADDEVLDSCSRDFLGHGKYAICTLPDILEKAPAVPAPTT